MSVGEVLSAAREQRGLSVEDVSADTRIRGTLIRAIEADDFAPCGGAVYARGHIRSIARIVGVDPEPLIAEFDQAHHVAPVQTTVAATPTDPDVLSRADRRKPNWAAAMGVALVAICVLAGFGLAHNGSGKKAPAAAQHSRVTTTTSTPPSSHPGSPPPSAVAQLPNSPDQATMLVRTTHGYTWLSVSTKSGGVLFSGILARGHQKLFSDKHGLVFTIGNSPAVDVVVNGHDIGSPHSAGLVSRGQVIPGANTVQQT